MTNTTKERPAQQDSANRSLMPHRAYHNATENQPVGYVDLCLHFRASLPLDQLGQIDGNITEKQKQQLDVFHEKAREELGLIRPYVSLDRRIKDLKYEISIRKTELKLAGDESEFSRLFRRHNLVKAQLELFEVESRKKHRPKVRDLARLDAQEVKARCDILEIAGRYTKLKRRGSQHIGLCPFHRDKTPSFSVDGSKGLWHCFGCNTGGDVINLVMRAEDCDFQEALARLS